MSLFKSFPSSFIHTKYIFCVIQWHPTEFFSCFQLNKNTKRTKIVILLIMLYSILYSYMWYLHIHNLNTRFQLQQCKIWWFYFHIPFHLLQSSNSNDIHIEVEFIVLQNEKWESNVLVEFAEQNFLFSYILQILLVQRCWK